MPGVEAWLGCGVLASAAKIAAHAPLAIETVFTTCSRFQLPENLFQQATYRFFGERFMNVPHNARVLLSITRAQEQRMLGR